MSRFLSHGYTSLAEITLSRLGLGICVLTKAPGNCDEAGPWQ